MTAPDKLALASRVEQAGGPDRELDAEIACLAGWRTRLAYGLAGNYFDQWLGPCGCVGSPPAYTASLDAITALIAEKLPGYRWQVWSGADGASIWKDDYTKFSDGEGATPALSLVVAFLRALASTEDRTP